MKQIELDDPKIFQELDPEGMLRRIHEFPAICEQAWQMAMDFDLPRSFSQINKVIVLGMGGSAIGGDLVSSLLLPEARLPIFVQRDYYLPPFADEQTLVIASSYSGETEETLTAFEQALDSPAKKLVITTGGRLGALAEQHKVPAFIISYHAQPRAALPFSFLPLLCFLQRLGITADKSGDVKEMFEVLKGLAEHINEKVPSSENPAKQLAQKLYGKLPVVYGGGLTAQVAHRWKTQFNENSKAWSFFEIFPELDHNAVVGYQFPAELASRMVVLMLNSSLLGKRIQLRYQITGEILKEAGIESQSIEGRGNCALSQMMSLVLLGDYVSYYLALLYRVDPSPVKVITYLKQQLAELGKSK